MSFLFDRNVITTRLAKILQGMLANRPSGGSFACRFPELYRAAGRVAFEATLGRMTATIFTFLSLQRQQKQ